MAAEITQIDIENFTSQTYEVQDTNLIPSFEINTSLTSSSYIELFIYDNNQNVLISEYNFSQYTVLNDGQSAGNNNDISRSNIINNIATKKNLTSNFCLESINAANPHSNAADFSVSGLCTANTYDATHIITDIAPAIAIYSLISICLFFCLTHYIW